MEHSCLTLASFQLTMAAIKLPALIAFPFSLFVEDVADQRFPLSISTPRISTLYPHLQCKHTLETVIIYLLLTSALDHAFVH